uniref:Patched family protein n=1 Tax=Caenorhabditis japonica TaxID=281687 RepID=A0A8R1HJQ6_CAEJA
MFDWFYQLTFFAAVMAMGARREAAGYHCVFVWKRCDREEIEKGKSEKAISPTRYFFENIFAPFICHPVVRIFVLVLYCLYIGVSFYGCSQLIPNLTPSRLVVDDSPLIPYLHLAEKKIWAEGLIGRIYVNNAPDFSRKNAGNGARTRVDTLLDGSKLYKLLARRVQQLSTVLLPRRFKMSIGQCIDFATHVGYRIYRSEHADPDERIKDAMGAIGWPVVQAGSSSLLAIVVMLMVPSSAVRMFARTSVLVVGTGFFHGLLVLPIIIRSFASNAKAHVPTHPH